MDNDRAKHIYNAGVYADSLAEHELSEWEHEESEDETGNWTKFRFVTRLVPHSLLGLRGYTALDAVYVCIYDLGRGYRVELPSSYFTFFPLLVFIVVSLPFSTREAAK